MFCLLVGGFGYVFVAQDVSTGKDYALKVGVCVGRGGVGGWVGGCESE